MTQLPPQRAHPLGILYRLWVRQLLLHFAGPLKGFGEAIT
jgi:hypothetical protein